MHRVNVTFEDDAWRKMERYCKKLRPYQPVGTTIREILLHGVLPCAGTEHDVLLRAMAAQAVASPSHARAGTDPSEKEREKERDVLAELEERWKKTEPFKLIPEGPIRALHEYVDMFPGEDLRPHTAAIAQWWRERDYPPKGRKRKPNERWTIDGISAGIRGWIRRAISGRSQPHESPKPSQGALFNGNSNGNASDWTKTVRTPDEIERERQEDDERRRREKERR